MSTHTHPRWLGILLWVGAFLIMTSAVIYQRTTGPTYPAKGTITVQGEELRYELIRSQNSDIDAEVVLPDGDGLRATLYYKRYNTDDEFRAVPFTPHAEYRSSGPLPKLLFVLLLFGAFWAGLFFLRRQLERRIPQGPTHEAVVWLAMSAISVLCLVGGAGLYSASVDAFWTQVPTGEYHLGADLPKQPAAGKLEYYLDLQGAAESRVPAAGEENVVIRFKDPVPDHILFPHVFLMFFGVLFGMRTGLAALFAPSSMRATAWRTLAILSAGGMFFGPIVQKYAFGAFWTGFPYGKDLTDNKMLIMWLAWLFAVALIGFRAKKKELVSRLVVLVAMLAMTGAYLIPHSMRGSELDYSKLEEGVAPHEAIGTSED